MPIDIKSQSSLAGFNLKAKVLWEDHCKTSITVLHYSMFFRVSSVCVSSSFVWLWAFKFVESLLLTCNP